MKCAQCGKEHNRRRFCSNACKDRYHNLHNPRGRFAHLADLQDLTDSEQMDELGLTDADCGWYENSGQIVENGE